MPILVVEVEQSIGRAAPRPLECEGFDSALVTSLEEAHKPYAAETPDVMLLDVLPPDGDRRALARATTMAARRQRRVAVSRVAADRTRVPATTPTTASPGSAVHPPHDKMGGMADPNRAPEDDRPHLVHDREVWGDDREEVDASAVVEEVADEYPKAEHRWHDHPAVAPFKAVALFIKRSGKRIAVTIVGFAVLLAGVAMLVLPGPGIVVIIAGLAILATEYVWAERMLAEAKRRAIQAKDKVTRKKPSE